MGIQANITLPQRALGPFQVSAIGLGCMNLSHAYGAPVSAEQGERVLLTALDAGVTHFDTAALYGFGANETLVGKVLAKHRHRFTLASKCGMTGVDGRRAIQRCHPDRDRHGRVPGLKRQRRPAGRLLLRRGQTRPRGDDHIDSLTW